MNVVNLFGRIARDIEIRRTAEGKAVARFTVAVNRDRENADFINCVAFDKTAELLEQYFNKGAQIALTGSIKTGSYTKTDGSKVYTTDVNVNRIYFVGSKAESKPSEAPNEWDDIGEELPFN